MQYKAITLHASHGIATIALNRPEKLNAIDTVMRRELWEAVNYAAEREEVRVLIFTGTGRAFSSGGDLSFFEDPWEKTSSFRHEIAAFTRTFDFLEAMEKPVIAAVNGICTGAGLQLTLSCDLRIAAESAAFAFFENNIGLIPAAGGCSRLVKLVGYGKAKEMIFLGEKIPAKEARAFGLVNRVVADNQLEKEARRIAETLLAKAPEALGLCKRVLHACIDSDLASGRFLESLGQSLLIKTRDHKEGLKAFHEKRKPQFQGK